MVEFVLLTNLIFDLQFLKHYSKRYEFFKLVLKTKKENSLARQAGLKPARPGERPGTSPKGPAFGRPRLGSQAGAVAERSGLVPAQAVGEARSRPGSQARELG